MLVLEQIESVDREELKQQNHIHKDTKCSEETTIYGHVNQHMEKNISSTLRKIYDAFESYDESEHLSNDKAIENLVKKFQKSIKDAKENKCMFSVPSPILYNKLSIIEYLMRVLHHLMNDENVIEAGKEKLQPLLSEMFNLVSTGTGVSQAVWELLPVGIREEHNNYLSGLKKIVCDSIEEGEEEDIVVQRDNAFYCVKCPEESIITPAKFMNSQEFMDLKYGALQMGKEGNVIRIKNGQYHDMKGKVKMTFKVSDSEKIEMILSSEKAESFGKIMVHMDDESCKIFSKYREELEKEPRISKVVEAASSVQSKPPLSSVDNPNIQHPKSNDQSVSS